MRTPRTNYLSSEKVALEIASELPIFEAPQDLMLTRAFVPGAKLSTEPPDSQTVVPVNIQESDKPSVNTRDGQVNIADTWGNEMPLYMAHLLYSIARKNHLDLGNYALHSSCVTRDDKGYLLIGHSGSGKTTTALEMVHRYKFAWYSGNKTLVTFEGQLEDDTKDNTKEPLTLTAIAGTHPVTVEASNPVDQLPIFQDTYVPFVDRKLRLLRNEYVVSEEKVAINAIILARVNTGIRKASRLSPEGSMVSLFPFFYDYFNSDIHVPGDGIFNPGMPENNQRKKLKTDLTRALAALPIYQVSSSFDNMAHDINTIAEELA